MRNSKVMMVETSLEKREDSVDSGSDGSKIGTKSVDENDKDKGQYITEKETNKGTNNEETHKSVERKVETGDDNGVDKNIDVETELGENVDHVSSPEGEIVENVENQNKEQETLETDENIDESVVKDIENNEESVVKDIENNEGSTVNTQNNEDSIVNTQKNEESIVNTQSNEGSIVNTKKNDESTILKGIEAKEESINKSKENYINSSSNPTENQNINTSSQQIIEDVSLSDEYNSPGDFNDDEDDLDYVYEKLFAHMDDERLTNVLATKQMVEKEDEETQKLQQVIAEDGNQDEIRTGNELEKEAVLLAPKEDFVDKLPLPEGLSPITNREKQGLLMKNFNADQSSRYEAYKRSSLSKSFVKKISMSILGQSLPAPVHYAISGVAKYFLMEILEKSRDVYEADQKVKLASMLGQKRKWKLQEYKRERELKKRQKNPKASLSSETYYNEQAYKSQASVYSPYNAYNQPGSFGNNPYTMTSSRPDPWKPTKWPGQDENDETVVGPVQVKLAEKPQPLLPSHVREAFRLYKFENLYPTNNWRQQGEGNGDMFR